VKAYTEPYFFNIFKDQPLIHCFSTRKGGFSQDPFKSLNLGLSTPDNKNDVKKNRKLFFDHLKIDPKDLAIPRQIHSDNIILVDKPGIYSDCDALVTGNRGVILTIQTADCFPVFIFDPDKNVCSIVHSGWRGTAKNITGQTIMLMKKEMNCIAENMLVAIGAGVQQRNYQVDSKTAAHFDNDFLLEDGKDHFRLDIQGNIIAQVLETGVLNKNIECDTRCTYDTGDFYYSYRRDGQYSGRMMGVIGLL